MKRYYFNKRGYDATEPCAVKNNGIKIGSVSCQECEHHLESNKEDFEGIDWLICEKIEDATTDNENEYQNQFIDRIIDIPFKKYTGCYLLYSENELVYVGVACDVAVRLWQHRYIKGKHWDSVKYIEETDYLKAIQIENYFINTYKPKYNKSPSKLEWSKLSFNDKFDKSKIPYPSGWKKRF
jgi:ssDNA-binding Zn-finger/Zn-ribbon topoisomerase 1